MAILAATITITNEYTYIRRWTFVLDNVRAYTAGCFQQCFLSFRLALPSLLLEGGRLDRSVRKRDNAWEEPGVGGWWNERGSWAFRSAECKRFEGTSLEMRSYDFFRDNDALSQCLSRNKWFRFRDQPRSSIIFQDKRAAVLLAAILRVFFHSFVDETRSTVCRTTCSERHHRRRKEIKKDIAARLLFSSIRLITSYGRSRHRSLYLSLASLLADSED